MRIKLQKLREVRYELLHTCDLCLYGHFPSPTEWGECAKHQYEHLKHTGAPRHMSTHRSGTCENWELNLLRVYSLGAYTEFLYGYGRETQIPQDEASTLE